MEGTLEYINMTKWWVRGKVTKSFGYQIEMKTARLAPG